MWDVTAQRRKSDVHGFEQSCLVPTTDGVIEWVSFVVWNTKLRGTEQQSRRKEMAKKEVVCVTGGSGGIGSWLVLLLLDRGYTVHATVKNLSYFLYLSLSLYSCQVSSDFSCIFYTNFWNYFAIS